MHMESESWALEVGGAGCHFLHKIFLIGSHKRCNCPGKIKDRQREHVPLSRCSAVEIINWDFPGSHDGEEES